MTYICHIVLFLKKIKFLDICVVYLKYFSVFFIKVTFSYFFVSEFYALFTHIFNCFTYIFTRL